jgi:hypothetical protein
MEPTKTEDEQLTALLERTLLRAGMPAARARALVEVACQALERPAVVVHEACRFQGVAALGPQLAHGV